jgi:hypothetical protein
LNPKLSSEALETTFEALESIFEALEFDFEAGFCRVSLGLIGFVLLSLAMLGLGERKGEKRVWDAGWWWLGFSGVVVVVGRRGGKK